MNPITTLVLVALASAAVGGFAVHSIERKDAAVCDVHPKLSEAQLRTMRANIIRARTQTVATVTADGKDKDVANRAGEDAAFDTFVHDLRIALNDEYMNHRRQMDGCF